MNPETLLHDAADLLHVNAKLGPGMMFLMYHEGGLFVTRTPSPAQTKSIVVKYDCTRFSEGLTVSQWTILMKKLWSVYKPPREGAAGGQKN